MAAEVPALRRSVALLRHLASSNRPVSAGTLARSLAIPRSSIYDLLAVLEDEGLVAKAGLGYLLGPGVSELGSAYMRANPLQRAAQPIIRTLAETAGGTAQLAVLRGWETVYLVKEQALNSVAVITASGVHMPSYLTATGRAILSRLERREVVAVLAQETDDWVTRTGRGPQSLQSLLTMLRSVRQRGYEIESGEITPGIWTLGAPVLDALDRPIAAVGISLPEALWSEDSQAATASLAITAAEKLSARLR